MRCSFCWQEKERCLVGQGNTIVICHDCVRKGIALMKATEDKVVLLWGKNENKES